MEDAFIGKMKTELLAQKKQLEKLIQGVADSDTTEHVPGKEYKVRYEDIGTDIGEGDENVHEQVAYEAALAQASSVEDRLNAVQAALERIEEGTYGVCVKCGEEIPVERLEANPAATTCVVCTASAK